MRCQWWRAPASDAGVIRKIGVTPPPYQRPYPEIWVPHTLSPASMLAAARRFEEAFDLAPRTAAYEWHSYFNEFGFAEMSRTADDDPNQPVMFADETALARCHPDKGDEAGDLGWLVWQFFQQGTTPPDVQRRQLEMFAEKVLPAIR
jgi:hypothetical protein